MGISCSKAQLYSCTFLVGFTLKNLLLQYLPLPQIFETAVFCRRRVVLNTGQKLQVNRIEDRGLACA